MIDVIESDSFSNIEIVDDHCDDGLDSNVFEFRLLMETEKAFLVSLVEHPKEFEKHWLPKSQVELKRTFVHKLHDWVEVEVPDWLVAEHGFNWG
jgi:hypothetical protein